jgi:hypothetical protein
LTLNLKNELRVKVGEGKRGGEMIDDKNCLKQITKISPFLELKQKKHTKILKIIITAPYSACYAIIVILRHNSYAYAFNLLLI